MDVGVRLIGREGGAQHLAGRAGAQPLFYSCSPAEGRRRRGKHAAPRERRRGSALATAWEASAGTRRVPGSLRVPLAREVTLLGSRLAPNLKCEAMTHM